MQSDYRLRIEHRDLRIDFLPHLRWKGCQCHESHPPMARNHSPAVMVHQRLFSLSVQFSQSLQRGCLCRFCTSPDYAGNSSVFDSERRLIEMTSLIGHGNASLTFKMSFERFRLNHREEYIVLTMRGITTSHLHKSPQLANISIPPALHHFYFNP